MKTKPIDLECAARERCLRIAGIQTPPGVEATDIRFFPSPSPCCAQLALPYWARVTGDLTNRSDEELLLRVRVIVGKEGQSLQESSDVLLLDPSQSGQFDAKLREFTREAEELTVIAEQIDEDDLV